MYNKDTGLIFPSRVIPALHDLRGDLWQSLVGRALDQDITALDRLALILLMVKLAHCDTCQADSYRALHGCTQCARGTVQRFQGSDQDLLVLFTESREEVQHFVANN